MDQPLELVTGFAVQPVVALAIGSTARLIRGRCAVSTVPRR